MALAYNMYEVDWKEKRNQRSMIFCVRVMSGEPDDRQSMFYHTTRQSMFNHFTTTRRGDHHAHQKDLTYNNLSFRNLMHCLIYKYICVSFLIWMTISLSLFCVFCIAIAIKIDWYSNVTYVIVLVCVKSIRIIENHIDVKEHWFNLWFSGVVVKTCVRVYIDDGIVNC